MVSGRSVMTNHQQVGNPYCEPPANSTGDVSRLTLSGSASISRSDLVLHASGLPGEKVCIVLLGGEPNEVNIGNSLLCVAGPIVRYTIATSNSLGRLHVGLPIDSLPGTYPGPSAPDLDVASRFGIAMEASMDSGLAKASRRLLLPRQHGS